jgi:hypothetical protein
MRHLSPAVHPPTPEEAYDLACVFVHWLPGYEGVRGETERAADRFVAALEQETAFRAGAARRLVPSRAMRHYKCPNDM